MKKNQYFNAVYHTKRSIWLGYSDSDYRWKKTHIAELNKKNIFTCNERKKKKRKSKSGIHRYSVLHSSSLTQYERVHNNISCVGIDERKKITKIFSLYKLQTVNGNDRWLQNFMAVQIGVSLNLVFPLDSNQSIFFV